MYVYKYCHPDFEWLYVGKADSSLNNRINAHKKEEKFQPYLNNCSIYYIEVGNKAQSKFIETFLIDKYKPHLNVVDKYEGNSHFNLELSEWKLYIQGKNYVNHHKCNQYKNNDSFKKVNKSDDKTWCNIASVYRKHNEELMKTNQNLYNNMYYWMKQNTKLIKKVQEYQIENMRIKYYPNLSTEEFEKEMNKSFCGFKGVFDELENYQQVVKNNKIVVKDNISDNSTRNNKKQKYRNIFKSILKRKCFT